MIIIKIYILYVIVVVKMHHCRMHYSYTFLMLQLIVIKDYNDVNHSTNRLYQLKDLFHLMIKKFAGGFDIEERFVWSDKDDWIFLKIVSIGQTKNHKVSK